MEIPRPFISNVYVAQIRYGTSSVLGDWLRKHKTPVAEVYTDVHPGQEHIPPHPARQKKPKVSLDAIANVLPIPADPRV